MPSIFDTVTASIIAQIEAGAGKFEMPWHAKGARADSGGLVIPFNATTGNIYQGLNVLLLWSAGHVTQRWATYKQWQSLGAQVRKGERATACIKWKAVHGKRSGDSDIVLIPLGFSVFHESQVDGAVQAELPLDDDRTVQFDRLAHAEAVFRAAGSKLTHTGARAFYRPSTDEIVLPDEWRFTGTATSSAQQSYYSTLAHEHVHWTGAKSRLDRNLRGRFGDDSYAAEELIAELGAAFICARLGISNEPRLDHAQYLASWLKVLKADSRAIVTAASAAQKACDFLLNRLEAPAPAMPLAA